MKSVSFRSQFFSVYRFFGMYSPLESMRIAMYRKAGITIGKLWYFGSNVFLDSFGKITIEDGVTLAGFTKILGHTYIRHHPEVNPKSGVVTIKKGAFVGIDVDILPGVTIGENSVVGAKSLVTTDIPANCLAAGRPAKVKKFYN